MQAVFFVAAVNRSIRLIETEIGTFQMIVLPVGLGLH